MQSGQQGNGAAVQHEHEEQLLPLGSATSAKQLEVQPGQQGNGAAVQHEHEEQLLPQGSAMSTGQLEVQPGQQGNGAAEEHVQHKTPSRPSQQSTATSTRQPEVQPGQQGNGTAEQVLHDQQGGATSAVQHEVQSGQQGDGPAEKRTAVELSQQGSGLGGGGRLPGHVNAGSCGSGSLWQGRGGGGRRGEEGGERTPLPGTIEVADYRELWDEAGCEMSTACLKVRANGSRHFK